MELRVGNRVISKYNSVSVSLKYDAVGDTFAYSIYFDPASAADRATFIPGNYLPCTITNNGETLITGVLLSNGFSSSATKQLMQVGGYSRSGVLDDCQVPLTAYPVQLNNMSLAQIATTVLKPFGLKAVIDPIVQNHMDAVFDTQNIAVDQTIKDFLTKLATQKNIVLSHDSDGNLLFTRANTKKTPIYYFDELNPAGTWTKISLTFDGQQMHSIIWASGQANIDDPNKSEGSITNPYVQSVLDWEDIARTNTILQPTVTYKSGYRPSVSIQTSGGDNDTGLTVRQLLAKELKGITMKIELSGWTLNGQLVRPNNIITVRSPENFLYQQSKWFIESVDFNGDATGENATLNCVLPECYNNDTVINVFTGSNLTVQYNPPVTGAHATITPFI